MRFVIVTGMSGAGKSTVLNALEDMRFFCVDNLPTELLEKFAALMLEARSEDVQNVAIGIDVRSGDSLKELENVLSRMRAAGYRFEVLFLDASDDTLVKRYKETRRRHPLSMDGRIIDGITLEREKLKAIRTQTDYLIDTSRLLTRDLKQELTDIFDEGSKFGNMMISVLSFGFKYGIPSDADLVFDVRFLPNPYYVDELRSHTGLEEEVSNFVFENGDAGLFVDKLVDMLKFLLPRYSKEGKTSLVIAVGCTGGKHRSVAVAKAVFGQITGFGGFGCRLEHRDIEKDRPGRTSPAAGR